MDMNLFPMSSGASERVSERTNERSEQCGASESVSGATVRANERREERKAHYSMRRFHRHSTPTVASPHMRTRPRRVTRVVNGLAHNFVPPHGLSEKNFMIFELDIRQ